MPDPDLPTHGEPTRPFGIVLGQLEEGHFHDEASEELRKLAQKLREHSESNGGAKGKLIITLDLQVDKGLLLIVPNIEVKAPKARRKSSVMWITEAGNLSPENPKQVPMFPRALPAENAKPREAPAVAPVKEVK
jgi:hypothetical protein